MNKRQEELLFYYSSRGNLLLSGLVAVEYSIKAKHKIFVVTRANSTNPGYLRPLNLVVKIRKKYQSRKYDPMLKVVQ